MRIFFLCCVAVFSLLSCKTEVNDVGNVPERGFHSNRPANIWEESLVTGNGVMGAMVMGDPYRESIVLNHALLRCTGNSSGGILYFSLQQCTALHYGY